MTDPEGSCDDPAAVFEIARQLEGAERQAYLDRACQGNPSYRAKIESMIEAHAQQGRFLADPTVEVTSGELARLGSMIGPYKLLQQIGEGGMGVVFMAEQKEPVKRRVALKIIKPGMDSRQVIARFEAERQALAMMDHPNIAKVLDAGATESGRPYFVMELVKGIPITEYCDTHKLTPRERLELFVDVCQAIQHAHQKGIIHRDLKPSNVLVARFDDSPTVKVIDFGVAKATNQELTERTMFTQLGQIVGTLEYMSPEQAQLNQLDIDTRSDIYSLGVLLYELLTGETPFDRQRLRSVAFDEMLRIIREEEPPKPSVKLRSSATLSTVAENRRSEPNRLGLLIRGDLDWIVMTALAKDRSRRYASATVLSDDVVRYLKNEPIVARPPSASYRCAKFAVRNKLALTMVTAISLLLVAGLAATTWYALRLDATVDRLIESLVRQAVTAAMSGNLRQAEAIISEARVAGADDRICRNLQGLAAVYAGKPSEATPIVNEVLAEDPRDLTALCIKWLSAVYGTSDYGQVSDLMEEIGAQEPSADSYVERLLFAQVNLYRDPTIAEDYLKDLARDYPNWPVLQALYAAALVQRASDAPGDNETRREFVRALKTLGATNTLAPSNRYVRTEYLMALTYAIELDRALGLAGDEQQWINVADRLAREIAADTTDSAYWSRALRAYYLVQIHHADHDPLIDELNANSTIRHNEWLSVKYFVERDARALHDLASDSGDPFIDIQEAYLTVENAADAERKNVARKEWQRLFSKTSGNSAWAYCHGAVGIPLFAGDLAFAKQQARSMLERKQVFLSRWDTKCMEYFANPSPEAELRLLHEAGPFTAHQSYAHNAIAMVSLAGGDREKAKSFYGSVVKAGRLDWGFYLGATAVLSRMEDDPNWPSWIEPKGGVSDLGVKPTQSPKGPASGP